MISAVQATAITQNSATIIWTTNEPADTQVEYGLTASYGSATVLNPTLSTGHSQPLTGLAIGTIYHYRVKSKDAAGNLATSADLTFTTSSAPVDVTRYLSDLTWTSATNGWGPVEKDKSNGEQAAGDGRTITLNTVTFAKGLGAHAERRPIQPRRRLLVVHRFGGRQRRSGHARFRGLSSLAGRH